MTLKKRLICLIILATMLSSCASTMTQSNNKHKSSSKSTQQEERQPMITEGAVEHFAIGALIAAPLAFAIPVILIVLSA